MTDFWDAKSYCLFLDLRTRPARDLLAAIPASFSPKTVLDLGCGPGNSTVLLKNRWPQANVSGLDSSARMLEEAALSHPDIHFIKADIASFSPAEKIDCLFANASLQWLEHHETLLPALLRFLKPGGIFAIQMPNNFHSPAHQLVINVLASNEDWQPLLKKLLYGIQTEPFYKLSWYYDVLTEAGAGSLQLWETEYCQEMPDYESIFDWLKGTGLRPVLSAMDYENQTLFANTFVAALSHEYPMQANKHVLLPYRRLFMLGTMPEVLSLQV